VAHRIASVALHLSADFARIDPVLLAHEAGDTEAPLTAWAGLVAVSYATLAERPVTLGTRAMLQACAARHAQAALALLHRISSARGKTGRTTLERTLARDRLPLHLACLEDCGAVFAVELTARVACHVRAAALPPLVKAHRTLPYKRINSSNTNHHDCHNTQQRLLRHTDTHTSFPSIDESNVLY
jgi:hypothetical protein